MHYFWKNFLNFKKTFDLTQETFSAFQKTLNVIQETFGTLLNKDFAYLRKHFYIF